MGGANSKERLMGGRGTGGDGAATGGSDADTESSEAGRSEGRGVAGAKFS